MESFLDIFPETVHSAGRTVAGQSADAEALTSALLTDIDNAAAEVVHAVVSEALTAYGADWMRPTATALVAEVEALGINTSGSATVVAGADADADAGLSAATGSWLLQPFEITADG